MKYVPKRGRSLDGLTRCRPAADPSVNELPSRLRSIDMTDTE